MKLLIVFMATLFLLTAPRVSAHHAFGAEFDPNRPLQLRGKIVRIEWTNPHSWFHVEQEEEGGTTTVWMVEAGTPNTLFRRGIHRNTVPLGTEVIIDGFQAKDETNRANGRRITLANGDTIFMGSSGTGAPTDGANPARRR